jgi:hypothetical protein
MEGQVSAPFYRLYQNDLEPEYAAKPTGHFINLFEAPTLFYAACLARGHISSTSATVVKAECDMGDSAERSSSCCKITAP